MSGVFAIADIRTGSVKGVGSAIGEGAAVMPEVHARLAHAMSYGAADLAEKRARDDIHI